MSNDKLARSAHEKLNKTLVESFSELKAGVRSSLEAHGRFVAAAKEFIDAKAYKTIGYANVDEYCADVLGIGKQYFYRLLRAKNTAEKLLPVSDEQCPTKSPIGYYAGRGVSPKSEGQIRALSSVPEEEQAEVWDAAVEKAGGKDPTYRHVEEAVDEASSETTGSVVVDKVGRVVPDELVPVFASESELNELRSKVLRLGHDIKNACDLPVGAWLHGQLQAIGEKLRDVSYMIRISMPFAVASPAAKKRNEKIDRFGWLTEDAYKKLPEDER